MNITEPLRVAVGSHQARSGKGCAMNVVSWMNGDTTITDTPDCADLMLARIVQSTNDNMCSHRDGDLLCAPCSIEAIKLGIRTIGTGDLPLTDNERHVVWVRVACRLAREVAYLNTNPRVMAAIEAAEKWADEPRAAAATAAAYAAHAANATDAARAATYAAHAATYAAHAAHAANAATAADYAAHAARAATYAADAADAAYAARAAAYAARAANARICLGHLAIDTFNELTGRTETTPTTEAVTVAYRQMVSA